MAGSFGKQLLDTIETVGFDELLNDIYIEQAEEQQWFNCAQIDGFLQQVSRSHSPPVIDITSTGAGGGKTHLIYLLTTLAVLSTRYGGREGCVVVIDADNKFSEERLAQQIRHHLEDVDIDTCTAEVRSSLRHVYIYKPQSMRGLVDTINGLPEHFLTHNHQSLDRIMSFIALDSVSAFYWQTLAEDETLTYSTQNSADQLVTYEHLRTAIEAVKKTLQCPLIMTSRHRNKLPKTTMTSLPRALSSSLPLSIAVLPSLRLLVRRIPVKRLPTCFSIEELLRENTDREKVVSLSRFECVVNEFGLNQIEIQKIRVSQASFNFSIKQEGLSIEVRRKLEDSNEAG